MKRTILVFVLSLSALVIFGLIPQQASAQPSILVPPEDVTIQRGRRAFINQWPGGSRSTIVFVGECCDRSTPYEGGTIFTGELGVEFTTRALFETTIFFIEICNDFGCAFSRNITVTVLPFESALILGGPWWFSDWLGTFNVDFAIDGWLFHTEHDWLFLPPGSTVESFFFYDLSSQGWYWTNNETYPNLFSFSRNSWVFYFKDTSGPREFVDLTSGEFFNMD